MTAGEWMPPAGEWMEAATEGCFPAANRSKWRRCAGSSNPSWAPKRRASSPSLEYRAAGALARVVQATPTGSHQWASAFGGVE